METLDFLTRERQAIVDGAEAALGQAHVRHYDSEDDAEVRRRLDALYDCLLEALAKRDLGPMIAYARQVAGQRFAAGYDLAEVQTAFGALETAAWSHVIAAEEPARLAETLGLVSTILGAGKDALGRAYVSLATDAHAPSLDLRALFQGTEGL